VDVVVPLRVVTFEQGGIVVVVFEHQVHRTPGFDSGPHALGELGQKRPRRIVGDLVDRVQPQTVETVFVQPIAGILHEELADVRVANTVEVDPRSPRRLVPIGEKRLGVGAQVVPLGPEVIVDDVEQHAQAACVRCIDEGLQLVGRPVCVLRCEQKHAVVSPVARAGRLGERHEFDRGDTECRQFVEPARRGSVGSLGRERTQVEFVQDDLVPRPAGPVHGLPRVAARVNDHARRVHSSGLEARRGVGHAQVEIGKCKRVAAPDPRALDDAFEPALAARVHCERNAVDHDVRGRLRRCPEAKPDAVVPQLRTKRHAVCAARCYVHSARSASTAASSVAGRRARASRTSRKASRTRKKRISASRCAGSRGTVARSPALAA